MKEKTPFQYVQKAEGICAVPGCQTPAGDFPNRSVHPLCTRHRAMLTETDRVCLDTSHIPIAPCRPEYNPGGACSWPARSHEWREALASILRQEQDRETPHIPSSLPTGLRVGVAQQTWEEQRENRRRKLAEFLKWGGYEG